MNTDANEGNTNTLRLTSIVYSRGHTNAKR